MSRYARQVALSEVGHEGQLKLHNARVLCVGAGGLGSPIALYLAAAGVGEIGLVDADRVDVTNLQRQILFKTSEQGELKTAAAARRLRELNPEVRIQQFPVALNAQNAIAIMSNYDVIIDGTDNFAAKFLINDAAVILGKPMVFGSISRFEGQVSVFWSKHGPCYRCLYPEPPKHHIPNCAEAGVLGAIAGVVGSLQAAEALKLIINQAEQSPARLNQAIGTLLVIDSGLLAFSTIRVPRNEDCPVCSLDPAKIVLKDLVQDSCASSSLVTIEQVRRALSSAKVLLVDVRELDEWNNGHIEGAVHCPLSKINRKTIPHIETYAFGRSIVLYCQSGVRSARALELLRDYMSVPLAHLKGGFSAWCEGQ